MSDIKTVFLYGFLCGFLLGSLCAMGMTAYLLHNYNEAAR